MHILDTTSEQASSFAFRAPPAHSASTIAKKRMMDLLQNILIKVKKTLKNQKALYKNQKAIATHLSTLEDPLILLSLSEKDSEEEATDEAPLDGDEDEDDNAAAVGDEEDEDDEDEDKEEESDD